MKYFQYSDCETKNYFIFTLRQVGSWSGNVEDNAPGNRIKARVPSFQRGLVWEPQQIELLWDSIFRGFPIGSIVIIDRIKEQHDKSNPTHAKSEQTQESEVDTSHHILDGQQRCNAIAWGFVDPWKDGISNDVVLWLDLIPKSLLKNTTRKYLFRVATKAHPWGFHNGDEASILKVEQRKEFMGKVDNFKENFKKYDCEKLSYKFKEKYLSQNFNERPLPSLALPYYAEFPVPVFLLFRHFKEGKLDWDALAQEEWISFVESWAKEANKISDISKGEREIVESGLRKAEQCRLIALLVSNEGIENSIDNIEQIFQRLNGQGTPLDNEELIYSMIKAYWPEIEEIMNKLAKKPITDVRLVNLGIRIALTEESDQKIESQLTVDQIRKIFSKNPDKDIKDLEKRERIEKYFGSGELEKALIWIDESFLYEEKSRTYGLPAYLRSSIAWSSREVFAWLMLLAKRYQYISMSCEDKNTRRIIGLALVVHWFGIDKEKAINRLINESDLSSIKIADMNKNSDKRLVLVPLNITDLNEAFQLDENSSPEQLINWSSFWQGVVVRNKDGKEKKTDEQNESIGLFIEKLRQQQELLVYAQREYLEDAFKGFDPSNKLMWKGHNRPWDYDHILASEKLNGTGKGKREQLKFHEICKAWQQSIGNQVAVDFSFNRAAQDIDPIEKYKSVKIKGYNLKERGFDVFASDDELESFKLNLSDLQSKNDPLNPARSFVLANKKRLIKIYQEWYDNLQID
ncbi:DUF262 domain-containing protein [Nitrosomonas sp. Is35]|uniref:DUF262 domain-containing protein n=1 Tax=Nitrosomonas sp. Is35 TaxID=3080534 RepID=UPI00294B6BD4|nr:DUF262 domain-containing protein [Nitrosomonas sp. Is35]MDV6348159.1 DUF262 domain-containing protein [Nitrosomonas sp. Is35]